MKHRILASLLVVIMVFTSAMPVVAADVNEVETYSETESEEAVSETGTEVIAETEVAAETETEAATEMETEPQIEKRSKPETEEEAVEETKGMSERNPRTETSITSISLEEIEEKDYIIGIHTYRDVLRNTKLVVTYEEGEVENVEYDDYWRFSDSRGNHFSAERSSGGWLGDGLSSESDEILVYCYNQSDVEPTTLLVAPRVVIRDDLEHLDENETKTPSPNNGQYQYFWFTPNETAEYYDAESGREVDFYIVEDDGSLTLTEEVLIEDQYYIVGISVYYYDTGIRLKARLGIQSLELSMVDDAYRVVELFDTDEYGYKVAQNVWVDIEYADGESERLRANEYSDRYGASISYELQEVDEDTYEFSAWLGAVRNSSEIPVTKLADLDIMPLSEDVLANITLTEDWSYYSFIPVDTANYVWIMEDDVSNVQMEMYHSSRTDVGQSWGDTSVITQELQEGETYYLRVKRYWADDAPSIATTILFTKATMVENIQLREIDSSKDYIRGLHTPQDVLQNIEVVVTYQNGSASQILGYNRDRGVFQDSYANKFSVEVEDQNMNWVATWDRLSVTSAAIIVYSSLDYDMRDSLEFDTRQIVAGDLATLSENVRTPLYATDGNTQYFWFTPTKTAEYYDSESGAWVNFYTIQDDGGFLSVEGELTQGKTYIVETQPHFYDDVNVRRIRLTDRKVVSEIALRIPENYNPLEIFEANIDRIAENVQIMITYNDSSENTATIQAHSPWDNYGNYFYYDLQIEAENQYIFSVWLYRGEDIRASISIPVQSLNAVTSVNDSTQITLNQEWGYYSFTPEETGVYHWQMTDAIYYVEMELYNSEGLVYRTWDSNGIIQELIANQTYYLRIRFNTGESETDEVTSTLSFTKVKAVESISLIEIDNTVAYTAGLQSYRDVLQNTRLIVTYEDGETETLEYSGNWHYANSSLGYRFYFEYDEERLRVGENYLSVYLNDNISADLTITAQRADDEDLVFGRLTEGVQQIIRAADGNTQYFWFTPEQNEHYYDYDVSYLYVRFYTLDNEGNWTTVDGALVANENYIAVVNNILDYNEEELFIMLKAHIQIKINETVLVGHDKNYNFTQQNTILNLTFTPEEDFEYVIESHGLETDTWIGLYVEEDGELEELAYDDDGGDGLNFRLSYPLQAGVTYIYRIRLYDDAGSFRVTLNGVPHTHTYSSSVVTRQATCGAAGASYRDCTQCGHRVTQTIPATGRHQFTREVIVKAATCGTAGSKRMDCATCGTRGATSAIPATGRHTYGAYVTTKEATAVVTGTRVRTCTTTGCNHKDTATTAKLAGYVKFNFSGTLPLKVKQSTTAVKVTMEKGDSITSWKSSNTKIVTVSRTGKITGKKAGTATVTVTLKSGVSKSFKVKVTKAAVKTKSIKLNMKKVTLKKGKKATLAVALSPITTREKVRFSTSNKKVATVSSKGVIQARRKGKATITVRVGTRKATCKVTVK